MSAPVESVRVRGLPDDSHGAFANPDSSGGAR